MNLEHCKWCGATAFYPSVSRFVWLDSSGQPCLNETEFETELRCYRCNQGKFCPLTLSTLQPFSNVAAIASSPRSADRLPLNAEKSVALGFAAWRDMNPGTVEELSRDLEFEVFEDGAVGHALIPILTAPNLHANDLVELEVRLDSHFTKAETLEELEQQVEHMFEVLDWAFAAGDEFEPTEVWDCGTNILGCCVPRSFDECFDDRRGCGAWPGEYHMQREAPDCPESLFWGTWEHLVDPRERSSRPAMALLAAARSAFALLREAAYGLSMSELVNQEWPISTDDSDDARRLALAVARIGWWLALAVLPEAVETQLALFPGVDRAA